MPETADPLNGTVLALIPSLSRSLEEQFSIFRVMHHGTHEKQLSNVFAWLLTPDASHGLGDTFQRIFLTQINDALADSEPLATIGWTVRQEVDTSPAEDPGKDIADIVLTSSAATLVIENFATSDGHGHGYHRYLSYGTTGGRRSVVVLLCIRRETHRQTQGWEEAVVITYAELIARLKEHVARDAKWRRTHPQQFFFIDEMARHFVEAPMEISSDDRSAFIDAMCQTGEAVRFSYRPIDTAAEEFADLVARHAKQQFEAARLLLQSVKSALRGYAQRTLMEQVNTSLETGRIEKVSANFQGRWEWCIVLRRADERRTVYLDFGPTAAMHYTEGSFPIERPDFTRIFVSRKGTGDALTGEVDRLIQTDVTFDEVLAGLTGDDTRLRDAILAVVED